MRIRRFFLIPGMAAPAVPVVETVTTAEASGHVVLYSLREAADLLSCSLSHVYRLMEADVLPGVDISRPGAARTKLRIRSDDLAAFIDEQR